MTPRIVLANLVVRLRSLGREKSSIFFTIAFPVILVLVFGAIFAKPERATFDLSVQDLDQTSASLELIKYLGASGVFKPIAIPPEADSRQFVKEHKLNLLLIVPNGFAEVSGRRLGGGDSGAIVDLVYVYDPSSTSVTTKLSYLNAVLAATNEKMSGTRALMQLSGRSILDKKYRFIEFFVPGIIAMAVMTSCLSGALHANAELRQKGILRKLATTPITRADWLLASILYQLILASVSAVSILLAAFVVFDVRLELNAWLPLYVTLEVFAFVGIGMLLTPFAKEAESAAAAGNAFLFPMMFLSGTFFPVEMMPGFLQNVARVLPLYYVNEGLRASMIFVDNSTAVQCAAITAGVAAVVFATGALVTRWGREA